jgi:hypothetical protein
VWAAALVAYEALTRRNPYRSKNPVELAERHGRLRVSLTSDRPDLPSVATRMIDRALDPDYQRRPLPGQLRDALLRGAAALERGEQAEAEIEGSIDVPRLEPRVRFRERWLRAVPDPREAADLESALGDAEALAGRLAGVARWAAPAWPPALTAGAGALLLGALPFYPTGWPFAIALLAAVVALRLPLLAGVLVLAAALPLLGNLAFGLVPGAIVLGALWVVAMARDGRRLLLPGLAPLLAAAWAWSLYPLAAGSAPRPHQRAALGAAGALVATIVAGLGGLGAPLVPTGDLAGLGAAVAGSDDAIAAAAIAAAAIGPGPVLLAVIWAALAATAPMLRLPWGRPLLVAAALWLGVGAVATIAVGSLLAGAIAVPLAVVVGAMAGGMVIAGRARLATGPATTPAEAPERPTRG